MTARDSQFRSLKGRLDERIAECLSAINRALRDGGQPTPADVETIELLSKLRGLVPSSRWTEDRIVDVGFVGVILVILAVSALVRLKSTAVDIEVHAEGVALTVPRSSTELNIPGEVGEILLLSRARISGIEQAWPPMPSGASRFIELTSLESPRSSTKKGDGQATNVDRAVRLQAISLPLDTEVKLYFGIAYGATVRGMEIELLGANASSALFGKRVQVATPGLGKTHGLETWPISIFGRQLSVQLYPLDRDAQLTGLRNIHVSSVAFENEGHSQILGGNVVVRNRLESSLNVQPGDHLSVKSATPIFVRELRLSKGELWAKLSVPEATEITLGDDHPRNLMPTAFEWIQARWPTQLYAAITAIVGIWFALKRWKRSDS